MAGMYRAELIGLAGLTCRIGGHVYDGLQVGGIEKTYRRGREYIVAEDEANTLRRLRDIEGRPYFRVTLLETKECSKVEEKETKDKEVERVEDEEAPPRREKKLILTKSKR